MPTASCAPATWASWTSKGFVKIVDRKKDMILVSGFNVYPNEGRGRAAMHPGVLEVAAVGVPDENVGRGGEDLRRARRTRPDAEALIAHCRENLTGYKVPRHVEFRTSCRRPTSARSCAASMA
jgi:long-chain acyl-CoA synthetase